MQPRRNHAGHGVSLPLIASCAGLISASMRSQASRSLHVSMDCRVKPGNDDANDCAANL
jgi:hypothetical protein